MSRIWQGPMLYQLFFNVSKVSDFLTAVIHNLRPGEAEIGVLGRHIIYTGEA